MLKRLSKASRSGSGTTRGSHPAWEEAGSTNPNTPVVEDPGGAGSASTAAQKGTGAGVPGQSARGVTRDGSGEPASLRNAPGDGEPKKRHSRTGSKLFSRLTSKVSRSVSALLHGDSGPAEASAEDAKGQADRTRSDGQCREPEAEKSSASGSAEAGEAALTHEPSLPQKKKFHIPHPHLPGHIRNAARPHSGQPGGSGLSEGAEGSHGVVHKMHPSHLPHLHLRGAGILAHARDEAHSGQAQNEADSSAGGVVLLQQLHQAHERARKIVEQSRKQKEGLLQRARREVEQEATKLREEAEKEFEASAETEQQEDAAFIAETNNEEVDVDVSPEVMDRAVHFCIDQVMCVDVELPEELRKRLPVIKAHPPTFFRKSCASQYPTTRGGKGEPAILKAALEHSYRQSFNQSTAHYGSFVGQDNDGYRGPGLSNLSGSDGSREAKKDVYSAILGDHAWNDDEFHIDLPDTAEQSRGDDSWWGSGRRRDGEGFFRRGQQAFCQGCWPAVSS
ncbi:putative vacuolar (H+)-ATPase G subunit domain-containing protein [Neospora caninum Liverpool]|uniref:Putative vacuolar (H+)-ATPase G subunit domain-containing protein n=1 Tax=Neospora caninum (strain Liverpool) TaxID=572307 RepID=F0VLG2_NEOCL|nr:putative vacuolar (H+)-ATPase G subunit domain-containing protein [Neospora caninum Liverpool]CBZ54090.1 putative vacuolar (H+)-ATPase G subunit domain-containing protein [Neospora caninum Liverpool]CEL68788.1 TPA: vacuolar (H)-ATPase G subunit domain-containing protein, putative [Neospora caninum Liverpool]|eukprot:XP_003884121.1 putative vacuolar (H+)-ATPase G subunit domain-containing protein [Neospora caninum Liverpool]